MTDTEDENIFRSLGVEPIINCRGTFTIIGGSIERPEVLTAMQAASKHFVQYDELAEGVGKRLAEITGAEWGMIPDGCAAGLKHVTAACVTGGNPEKLIRIPDLTGLDKTQVIIPRSSRNTYDHAVRNIGVEIIMVETADDLDKAINCKTAMIYVNAGPSTDEGQLLSLEVIAQIAGAKGIPILVDAAAEDLTIPCIHLQRGATVVAYSGGKAMCGPQGAGLLLGDKDLLMSAWQASSPHHGPNRDNKISREEIMGMLAAVEAWVKRDHPAEWQTWLDRLNTIASRVSEIDDVTSQISEPTQLSNRAPQLTVSWDPAALHITGGEVAENFARSKPRVAIGSSNSGGKTAVAITPSQMQPGEAAIVADRIHAILSETRITKGSELPAAAADIGGHWNLTIEYSTSASQHRLFLQQDGNWVKGIHQSDFSSQPINGTVEGTQVKLHSVVRQVADSIPFMFAGEVDEGQITGSIHLGEYLTARFSAQPTVYDNVRQPVAIPSGPPLAT